MHQRCFIRFRHSLPIIYRSLFFGAAVGYNVIPFLHIADDANTLKALPENLLKIDIPPVMNVMTALVLAALIGLATAWVKSDEISKLLDTFQRWYLNW